jgi:dTDP-4-dehydrorhamnose reductase
MPVAMITGAGQLGTALAHAAAAAGYTPRLYGHDALDVAELREVRLVVDALHPQLILHTAALTRVNYCEDHPYEALAVNRDGARHVAEAAARVGARLVYFSTDYVFSGDLGGAYAETDEPGPLNAYGRSKLAGEEAVRAYSRGHVVRTAGVFGPRPDGSERNFPKAILAQAHSGPGQLAVVADQYSCISYAPHLAQMVFSLLALGMPPLVHLTSLGADSWHGWALQVLKLTGHPGERVARLLAGDQYGGVARPADSTLVSRYDTARMIMERYPAATGLAEYLRQLAAK